MKTNKEELRDNLKLLHDGVGLSLKDMRSYIPNCMLCSHYGICDNHIMQKEICRARIDNWLHTYASPQSSSRINEIVNEVKEKHYYKIKSYRDALFEKENNL